MKDRLRRGDSTYFARNDRLLVSFLVLLGALYVLIAFLPKYGDYWTTLYVSKAFALDPVHFMVGKTWPTVGYPPAFYALQGTWLNLGSLLFNYDLAVNSTLTNFTSYSSEHISWGIFPFWGMIPILTALFLLVVIAYKELDNRWLTLICFGPITFVAVGVMGQIDVVCALFIFISLILAKRALHSEKYFSSLLLGYLALGVSMEFKTYGGLLLPAYVIYTLALFRERRAGIRTSLMALGALLGIVLVATFIVWAPYPGWFTTIILGGPSNNLLQSPSLFLQVLGGTTLNVPIVNQLPLWPIWLLGYVFILSYMAARVLPNPGKYLQDDRYFIFFNATTIAWFFIAVFTHPQWWMFLIPAALLALDRCTHKAGTIAFVCILVVYPVYLFYWKDIAAIITSYHLPVAMLTGTRLGLVLAVLANAVLAGLLLLWVFALKRELDKTCA